MSEQYITYPVTSHTDHVGVGTTFVVIKGERHDGLQYLATALAKGASAIVLEHGHMLSAEHEELVRQYGVTVTRVDNARKALALLSAQAAGYPAEQLKLLGVTGTKGKTTVCAMLAHMLSMLGKKTAVITTAFTRIDLSRGQRCCGSQKSRSGEAAHEHESYGDSSSTYTMPSTLTTPHPDFLHQFFKRCIELGVEYVVMEVAVQAHTFHRLDGLAFEGVLFTNLEQEHGEHYPTMQAYFDEKKKLFDLVVPGGVRVANKDDAYARQLCDLYPGTITYAQDPCIADYQFTILDSSWDSQVVRLRYNNRLITTTFTGFPGAHNASNMVAAYALLDQIDLKVEYLAEDGIAFPAIPGRLEPYLLPNGACAIIDYAHTAGSFEKVLSFLRPRTKKLIVIFGAGGGKDHKKRPMMGAVAAAYADLVILTDDNPRFENPVHIVEQIKAGIPQISLSKVIIEHDRAEAIRLAYSKSDMGSVIVLFGKGPDELQIVQDQRIPFSEKAILLGLI